MNLENANTKLKTLKDYIQSLESVALAYSGGVDSTFLLKVAGEVLGEKAVAVTARSSTYPEREYQEAIEYAKSFGVKHVIIESEELDIEGFSENPVDRCYYCKNELFTKVLETALNYGVKHILDGSNKDDIGDYRPGMIAAKELGVLSPLKELGFSKEDIRVLSKEYGLPTWDKPAFACLSSRFPYGHKITKEKLRMVDEAEQFLLDNGFRNVRVRHYGDLARVEVASNERDKFFDLDFMDIVNKKFREIGFTHSALDFRGYRTGSMNEGVVPS